MAIYLIVAVTLLLVADGNPADRSDPGPPASPAGIALRAERLPGTSAARRGVSVRRTRTETTRTARQSGSRCRVDRRRVSPCGPRGRFPGIRTRGRALPERGRLQARSRGRRAGSRHRGPLRRVRVFSGCRRQRQRRRGLARARTHPSRCAPQAKSVLRGLQHRRTAFLRNRGDGQSRVRPRVARTRNRRSTS